MHRWRVGWLGPWRIRGLRKAVRSVRTDRRSRLGAGRDWSYPQEAFTGTPTRYGGRLIIGRLHGSVSSSREKVDL